MSQVASTSRSPAELDRRFYAYVVDRVVAWGLAAGLGFAAWLITRDPAMVALVGGSAWLLLGVCFGLISGTTGRTPGKAALGLRIVAAGSGAPIGAGAALTRAAILGIAGLPTAGLGVACLAWTAAMDRDRQRRAWHDHLANSLVIDVYAVPAPADEEAQAPQGIVNLTAMRLMPAPDPVAPSVPAPTPATSPRQSAPQSARSGARHDSGSGPGRAPTLRSAREPAAVISTWRVSFDTGESFVVEGLALVGRGPTPRSGETVRHVVPLRSSDMSLSKTHAQVHVAKDGALVVMDRGSTNGSVLVRKGVTRPLSAGRPATLVDGDKVLFGDREMTVSQQD